MKANTLWLIVCLALLGGCAAPTDPNAATDIKIASGPVRMPSGADFGRIGVVEEARLIRVYTQMIGVGDPSNDKLLFPADVASKVGLTDRQVNRRFMDMILESQRFQVFDDATTVVRDRAIQTLDGKLMDIVIDGQIAGSMQEIIDIAPYRKAHTGVRLSVQMKDVMSGEQLFPAGVSVSGDWGLLQGEGTVLAPQVALGNPDIQRSLANDYQRALDKALQEAVARINQVLRPLGRITSADGRSIGMVGGSRHGFQSGDYVVVFRAETTQLGGRTIISRTTPLAVARCEGVGTEFSQCDLTRVDPRGTVRTGDYVVLSDVSATGVREQ